MSLRRRPKKVNRRVSPKQDKPSVWRRVNVWLAPWRRGLAAVILLSAGLGVIWQANAWLQGMERLTLQQVRVEGRFEQLGREAVGALVAPYSGTHFFDIDVIAIKDRLEQQPWVRAASVRREWPDALVITLQEQVPVAHWGDRGLLNSRAEAFYPDAGIPVGAQQLPALYGVDGSQQTLLTRLYRVTEAFAPMGMTIAALHMDARGSWRISLSNGLQVMMGHDFDQRRINRLLAFYPALQQRGTGSLAVIDLRYPNGFAVRWQPVPEKKASIG